MADFHDKYDQTVVVNLVQDAVIIDANTPRVSAGELLGARRSSLISQPMDGGNDPVLILFGDSRQRPLARRPTKRA